jgi:hypothetical protein
MTLARKLRSCTEWTVWVLGVAAVTACGGASSESPAPASPPGTAVAEPAAPAATVPTETPVAKPEPSATSEASAESATPPPSADTAPHGTNITYRMTPSGLVVELEGVQLEPKAEPMKLGGGWGVKLVVRAKAVDEKEHHLQNPAKGPLMVAEEIDRGGKKELVPDDRSGDGELTIGSSTVPIERELRKPIVAGQSLTLYVGLWGLGRSADDRKPIKKLFVVKMVAGAHTPQPVVSAPE